MSKSNAIIPSGFAPSSRSNMAAFDQRIANNSTKINAVGGVGALALTAVIVFCKSTMNGNNDEAMAKLDTILQSLQLLETELNGMKAKNLQLTNQNQILNNRVSMLEFQLRTGQTGAFQPTGATGTTVSMPSIMPSIIPQPIISLDPNANITSAVNMPSFSSGTNPIVNSVATRDDLNF